MFNKRGRKSASSNPTWAKWSCRWIPKNRTNMEMITMKWKIILTILASLLIGVSIGSASFLTDPTPLNDPNWKGFSLDIFSNEINPWGYTEVIDLSEYLLPKTAPAVPDESSPWTPVPLMMPEPLPITKEELFGSLTTISKGKQSLLESYSTNKQSLLASYKNT